MAIQIRYIYNSFGQMTQVDRYSGGVYSSTLAKYYYDANGARAKTDESGTIFRYVYSGHDPMYYNSTDGKGHKDIYLGGRQELRIVSPSEKWAYAADALGLTNLCSSLVGAPLPIVNDARKRIAIYIVNDIAWLISMTEKKMRKENAKTRYDAKMPTVSFRVSSEERRRLDKLQTAGTTFREMILLGAGIIEDVQAEEKRLTELERKSIEEGAIQRALNRIALGRCNRCGKIMYWDLTNPYYRQQIAKALEEKRYRHNQCP